MSQAPLALFTSRSKRAMDEFLEQAQGLRTRMWKTAGARFLAARRLTRRERLSTFSIALLSVVAIALGLLEPHIVVSPHSFGISTASGTAIISVFILAISLIEGSSQIAVQASKLHENALHISDLRTKLEMTLARCRAGGTPDWADLESIRDSYETTLQGCPFNHEVIDYRRFQVDYRLSPEFKAGDGQPATGLLTAQAIKMHYLASTAWLSVVSWLVVITMVVLLFA